MYGRRKIGGQCPDHGPRRPHVVQFARWDLQQAVRLATLNPARVTGMKKSGVLEAGAPADLVVLSPSGEVRNTVVRGRRDLAARIGFKSSAAVRWRPRPPGRGRDALGTAGKPA